MGKTSIGWTGYSWNPIRARLKSNPLKVGWHCEKVSIGCGRAHQGCYSEAFNVRRGTGLFFKPGNRGWLDIFLDEEFLKKPIHWRSARMIFVCSMTDLFADFVPVEWLDQMFAVMGMCPRHIFQVLTKRPEAMALYLSDPDARNRIELAAEKIMPSKGSAFSPKWSLPWPLKNVWIGTSVEDQESADDRIPALFKCPAVIRWASYEPALAPVTFARWMAGPKKLDWIVVGGQSGALPGYYDLAWPRAVIAEGKQSGVAIFHKQLGAYAVYTENGTAKRWKTADRKGETMIEWPVDIRVREFPPVDAVRGLLTNSPALFPGQASDPA
jgi:protein gp37